MPTPTKQKPMKSTQSATEIALDAMVLDGQISEELLQEIVKECRKPRYEELNYFKTKCGWNENTIAVEVGRVTRVLRYQQIAGTRLNRELQQTESDRSAEILRIEGSEIKEQINALQSRLNSLERDAKLSFQRLTDMHDAVDNLRKNAPKYRSDEYSSRLAHIGQGVGYECLQSEGEVRFIEQMVALDLSHQDTIEQARTHFRDCVVYSKLTQTDSIDGSKWAAKQAGLRQQLLELRPKSVSLRQQYDEAKESIESLLDYYVD